MTKRLTTGFNAVTRTATGPPTTGTWAVGDIIQDSAGVIWRCTVAGTPGTWVGNIEYFVESRSTAAPNATIPAHQLTASGGETTIDFVILPKGGGAILAALPDNTATGGNKRGLRAVDLQMSRSGAVDVASGTESAILAGAFNAASGTQSAVIGGSQNNVSGNYSVSVGGVDNAISNSYSAAIAAASSSITHGYVLGHGSTPISKLQNSRVFGDGTDVSAAGGAQFEEFLISCTTTNATATPLTNLWVGQTIPLADHETVAVAGIVSAAQDGGTANYAAYNVEFCARRQSGVATTAIVGTSVVRAQESNTAWNMTITADTTNGAVNLNAVGVAATTIRWTGILHVVRRLRVT